MGTGGVGYYHYYSWLLEYLSERTHISPLLYCLYLLNTTACFPRCTKEPVEEIGSNQGVPSRLGYL